MIIVVLQQVQEIVGNTIRNLQDVLSMESPTSNLPTPDRSRYSMVTRDGQGCIFYFQ